MFIKSVKISNYRIFQNAFELTSEHIGVPDGSTPGSGLTVLVGENGVGKTSILEAIALPLISYRADGLAVGDFNSIQNNVEVAITAETAFSVKRTIRGNFNAVGFKFVGKLRSQSSVRYLVDTVVTDSFFIPADDESIAEGSPDLRTAVDNPFAGSRFGENDYIFIDKNRIKVLESGTYSTTRFDRVLEDLNFQYLQVNNPPLGINAAVEELISHEAIDSALSSAFEAFKELTGYKVKINLIHDILPYKRAFLCYTDMDSSQIPVEKMGSGYQMLLALICQQYLSLQSGRKLIVLIDEVELHLHPKLQKQLVNLLLELSKTAQIILTSHSPELLKDLQKNQSRKINAVVREGDLITINPLDKFVLPVPTISETNYVAFNLASMEYFIELYNQVGEANGVSSVAAIDNLLRDSSTQLVDWERDDGTTQQLTQYSCIRNKFHHPSNRLNDSKFLFDYEAVTAAITFLRAKLV
jgi:Predicted ATP-dependent endonuclease of the OLD family